jgi:mannose-1-phosphate guanylyltransferase
MKAVVLVGGEGTRMRPLTETTPKPLLPVMDRPSLAHVLDHLARHGVTEAVLSSPYLERTFHPFIESRHGDPSITWITERQPLGTGGAVTNALGVLHAEEPFFALNGDIVTDLNLTAMLAFHRETGASATIALHHVDDARAFGLIVSDANGRVREFREKPETPMPGEVNAGTYVLDPAALTAWQPGTPVSIEREVFPGIIDSGRRVFGYASDAYWLDLGTPQSYLQVHFDMLEGAVHDVRYPAPWIAEGAEVDLRAHVGRWVAVGAGAAIGHDAQVDDSVLHAGAVIGAGARVVGSVIGANARVGAGATLTGCVLGQGSSVADDVVLVDARVPSGADVLAV